MLEYAVRVPACCLPHLMASSALAPTELDLRSPPMVKTPGLLNRPIPAAAKLGALVSLVLGSLVALVALIALLPRDAKPARPTVRT